MEGESAGLKQLAGKTARPPPETRAAARRRTEEVEAAGAGGTFGPRQEDVVDVEEEATDAVAAQGAEGDGGARARANAAALMPAVRSIAETHAELYFKSVNEKKPQTVFDRKMCVVMGSSELPPAANGEIAVQNAVMWKHGDMVGRLFVDNHVKETHVAWPTKSQLERKCIGTKPVHSEFEKNIKEQLEFVFYEGTSMEGNPPKTGEPFHLLQRLVMLVDMMVRLAVLGEIRSAKDFEMHTAFVRHEYTYVVEKMEECVFRAETGKKDGYKARAALFDEKRYLPCRKEAVKKYAGGTS